MCMCTYHVMSCRVQDNDTPLHRAAVNNSKDVAEVLLKHGADVNTKNKVILFIVAEYIIYVYRHSSDLSLSMGM